MRQRSPAFDRVAEQLIEQAVAGLSDAEQVGHALDGSFVRLERALATMVGELGFRALFVRAAHLTRKTEPQLPLSVASSTDGARAGWLECIAYLGTEAATRCAALLCANVLVLLASFIGEDLTFRMIRRAFTTSKTLGLREVRAMTEDVKMPLKLLSTGVPGLDDVLGGGLPEYSFNLLAGTPGAGKTTLIHQLTFANASEERPALYFTVVGEPPLKMLRYQQQMAFFDPEKAGTVIRFIDLSQEVLTGDLAMVLEKMVKHVEDANPAIVVVDSFRTVLRSRTVTGTKELELQSFLQRLALHLTSWHVTSFLIGEYNEDEMRDNPVFTVADGIIWLSQHRERNSVVRKLEIVKMRGIATMAGMHTFRISDQGVRIFPRAFTRMSRRALRGDDDPSTRPRARFGIPALDEMLGGGLPAGDATIIAGPSGVGKTVLSAHFIADGVRHGEPGVLAVFEEHPDDYLQRAKDMGLDLDAMSASGQLKVLYLKPLDLSAEEILQAIQQGVQEISAKRLVIDSLNGVELALAATFREDFREALYRVVGHLTAGGVSVLMTVEVMESFNEIKFSPHAVSFLSQNILFLRYIELESRLRKMLTVIKMRRSTHSNQMREFTITDRGLKVLGAFDEYRGVLTGVPQERPSMERGKLLSFTVLEQQVLSVLQQSDRRTEAELCNDTGLTADQVQLALGRLIKLHHVMQMTEHSVTVYRALERPLSSE